MDCDRCVANQLLQEEVIELRAIEEAARERARSDLDLAGNYGRLVREVTKRPGRYLQSSGGRSAA